MFEFAFFKSLGFFLLRCGSDNPCNRTQLPHSHNIVILFQPLNAQFFNFKFEIKIQINFQLKIQFYWLVRLVGEKSDCCSLSILYTIAIEIRILLLEKFEFLARFSNKIDFIKTKQILTISNGFNKVKLNFSKFKI